MFGIKEETVEKLKKEYPEGTRVRLLHMNDPYRTIPCWTEGTVTGVDDIGTIHVRWDTGHCLGVAYGEDRCEKI